MIDKGCVAGSNLTQIRVIFPSRQRAKKNFFFASRVTRQFLPLCHSGINAIVDAGAQRSRIGKTTFDIHNNTILIVKLIFSMLFLVQVCEAPSSFSSSWRAEVQRAARGRRASPPSRGRLEFPLLRLSSRVLSSLAVNVNRCSREWNLTGPAGQPD